MGGLHYLHVRRRSVLPLPQEHIARALGDPVWVRDNEGKVISLCLDPDPVSSRLNGPARHHRIGDDVVRFTLLDAIITAAIAVLIGMIVAGAF